MARPHFVKKAAKDHPKGDIKKGDSYWWWAFMVGGRGGPKHFSKTAPRRSQLTQSEFYGALYDIEDDIGALSADDGLASSVEDIVGRLRELAGEQEEKKGNMPDGLQDGPIGEQLQERADACNSAADELDDVELDAEQRADGESEADFWTAKLEEVQAVSIDAP